VGQAKPEDTAAAENDYARLEEEAAVLKALAHPIRLCIVKGLICEDGCNVGRMQRYLGIPQSTVSQHLATLRAAGIVEGERDGVRVEYRVISDMAVRIVENLAEHAAFSGDSEAAD